MLLGGSFVVVGNSCQRLQSHPQQNHHCQNSTTIFLSMENVSGSTCIVITKKKGICMIYSQYFQSETTSRPTHSADDTFNSSQYERKGPLHRLRLLPFYLGTWTPAGRFVSCEVQLSLGINLPLPFHQKAARQRAYVQAA